jgi:hypothetical protein
MGYYKNLSAQNSSMKTLFDYMLPIKSSKSNDLTHDFVEEDIHNQSSIGVASCSSSTFKENEEIMKDQGTSTDPTLENQQLESVRQILICY